MCALFTVFFIYFYRFFYVENPLLPVAETNVNKLYKWFLSDSRTSINRIN